MTILLDYIYARGLTYNLIVLIQGDTQTGKSTVAKYLLDCLCEKKFGHDWDYKKFCARSFGEFIEMVDQYDNEIIAYEETSKDISIDTYWDDLNHFFNVILQTQGYKHNTYFIICPHGLGLSKRQRRFIKLGIEVMDKIDTPTLHASILKPTIYKRTYWRLDDDRKSITYKFLPITYIKYTDEDLKKSREYTTWLEGMKKEFMREIKRKFKKSERKKKEKDEILNASEEFFDESEKILPFTVTSEH